jgi:hypothetical protein
MFLVFHTSWRLMWKRWRRFWDKKEERCLKRFV